MNFAGFLLRRERRKRNWSQEGLCRDICTVSYLSKIEQGKAEPSEEILKLLMERMDLHWQEADAASREWVESLYEALFSYDGSFREQMEQEAVQRLQLSSLGADLLLLKQFATADGKALEEELEVSMDNRQLALQRVLQGRYDEGARLYPRAFFFCIAGDRSYREGNLTAALETLHSAYQMAAQEGCPRIMLHCKLLMGNCYSNQHDLEAMERHYRVARRLAKALKDQDSLSSIDYNTAATQIEAGQYGKAFAYFQTLPDPGRMDLHKLAICCERLGMRSEALEALDRADAAAPDRWMPEGLEAQILNVVRLRLTDPGYLKQETYGAALLACFDRCRKELPSGYAIFHLPWVMEWYEANRKYKQALELLKVFPEAGRKNGS